MGKVWMNIYFACSITGGRKDETIYQQIVATLHAGEHQVPTALIAGSDVIQLEKIIDPKEVFNRDTGWIDSCDLLVAEVSTPSHGVGFEIGYALHQNKPVLCLHIKGTPVSKMITGNGDPNLTVLAYSNKNDIETLIQNYLRSLE